MKKTIISDAVRLTTSKVISLIISMISAMFLSHFRTLEEYGTYSQLLIVINIFTTIFMLGLPTSINFFLASAKSDEEKQKFISIYYTLSTILSFITGLILVLSTKLIVRYFNNTLIIDFMYILAIYPWTKIILSSIENIYIIYDKTEQLMIFRIFNSILLLIIILFVEIFNLSFNTYMFLFITVESIFALRVYSIANKLCGRIRLGFDSDLIKKIFIFSIPLGLSSVLGTLNIELDKLMIGRLLNTEQLAIYTNAAREMPLTIISSSITAILMPQLVKKIKNNEMNEAIDLWGTTATLSYLFICFFATGLFVYAKDVISLLYSDKYLPGLSVFRIYTIVLLLRSTYFGIILNSMGNTRLIFYSSLASLVLNVVLNYLFYRIFGFVGPSIATFVSIFLVACFQLIATCKITNVKFKKILPWFDFIYITVINCIMGIMFYLIKVMIPLDVYTGEIIESIIMGLIWGILYVIIMLKSNMQKLSY
jgi:O-antigen/teichoic acid export membrane protein